MKLKTRGSAKKRVRITGSGKMLFDASNRRHRLIAKSKKAKGRDKYGHPVSDADAGMLRRFLPHSF